MCVLRVGRLLRKRTPICGHQTRCVSRPRLTDGPRQALRRCSRCSGSGSFHRSLGLGPGPLDPRSHATSLLEEETGNKQGLIALPRIKQAGVGLPEGYSREDPLSGGLVHIFFFFGHTARLAGSQFPDQGLNPGHGSESLES